MKKVLIVTKSEVMGGVEKVLLEIVHQLNKQKYSITVMTGCYQEEMKANLPLNVTYKTLFPRRFKGLDRLLIHLPPMLLHRMFIRKKYDIEISFQEGYPTKMISGADRRTKKICWFHNDPYYFDFNLPYYKNSKDLKNSLNNFDEIITVSNYVKHQYKKYMCLNKNLKVIYNSIDYPKITQLSKEPTDDLYTKPGVFRICYVGRMSEEKQVGLLLEAVIQLYQKYKSIELILLGEGYMLDNLKKMVNNANAHNYIKLLGYKNNPYKYISKSNLLVCSSKTESFGLVVAEAITLGIPVVSTKCGGPEEILENGKYGVLVENNIFSLVNGIEKVMKEQKSFVNLTESFFNKYNKNLIINKIEGLFEEGYDEKYSSL